MGILFRVQNVNNINPNIRGGGSPRESGRWYKYTDFLMC